MISSDFSWRFLELFESAQISTVVYRIYRLFQAISRSNPEVQNWAEIHTGTEPLWKPAEIVFLLIIIIKYIQNMLPMLNSGIDLPFGRLPTLDSMRIWGWLFIFWMHCSAVHTLHWIWVLYRIHRKIYRNNFLTVWCFVLWSWWFCVQRGASKCCLDGWRRPKAHAVSDADSGSRDPSPTQSNWKA